MKPLIIAELKQQQAISPQLYHSLKILQMNSEQLDEYLRDAVLENPVLEQEDSTPLLGLQSLEGLRSPLVWTWEEHDGWQQEDSPGREIYLPDNGITLCEHLKSQFYPALSNEEIMLLESIMDFLDDNGYLTASDDEISRLCALDAELVGYGVAYLQTLDPLGVCARELTECLGIQLERLGYNDKRLKMLVAAHLEDLAAGRYNKIAGAIGCTPQESRQMCATVRSLHPRPGASFGGLSAPPSIPDIIIECEGEGLAARVNSWGGAKIHINDYYARMARNDEYGEAAAYLEEKLTQAKWAIKAVESRKSTLQGIGDIIAKIQREFFLSPDGVLRPMTLSDAAGELELHESTISRAISGKTMQCPRGVFSLKYFFTAGIGNSENATSRNTVKDLIARFISAEDKSSPLSDSKLVKILADEGIDLSRRVVAKYRAELCILPSNARRL